jgi:2'-5' RNA ligase
MRLFFGLDPLAGDKRAIDSWRQRVATADGRPVPPANFHLTLAFLGEVDERRLEALCDTVDELALPGAGELRLDRVGYWPRPGILWIGPAAPQPALETLAGDLGRAGQAVGAGRERRRFVPHLTLYRGCRVPPPAPAEPPDLPFRYRGVTLFESRRGRDGIRYEPVAAWEGDG